MTAFFAWFTGQRLAWLAGGLALVGAFALGHVVVSHIKADAVARLLLAHDDSLITQYELHADSLHTTVVHDTIVQHRTAIQYKAIHDTVLAHVTDTVLVKEFVHVADTAIQACTRVARDCEQETAALRAELAASTDKAAQLAKLQPSYIERHVGAVAVLSVIAGVVLGAHLK